MIRTIVTVTRKDTGLLDKIFDRLGVHLGKSGAHYVAQKAFAPGGDDPCGHAPGEANQPGQLAGVVDVGWFGGAAPGGGRRRRGRMGADGVRHREQLNNATKMMYAEFGTVRQPPRPLFAYCAQQNRNYSLLLGYHAMQLVQGMPGTMRARLREIGETVKENLEQGIALSSQWARPNAPYTIDKKGFDHPLFEKGHAIDSIKVKVQT